MKNLADSKQYAQQIRTSRVPYVFGILQRKFLFSNPTYYSDILLHDIMSAPFVLLLSPIKTGIEAVSLYWNVRDLIQE